jgi:hypothetical protein
MMHSFLSEELAREHLRALSANAVHSARLAREARPRRASIRAAVGLRLVRVGLKLAEQSPASAFHDPARARG